MAAGQQDYNVPPNYGLKQKATMHIRAEQISDVTEIRTLTQSAFLNASHTSHTEHLIVDALRLATVLTVSLVATKAERIVGHVAVSPVSISNGAAHWLGWGLYLFCLKCRVWA